MQSNNKITEFQPFIIQQDRGTSKFCTICKSEFKNLLLREHQCKRCLSAVCSKCSTGKALIIGYQEKPKIEHRICSICAVDSNFIKKFVQEKKIRFKIDSPVSNQWLQFFKSNKNYEQMQADYHLYSNGYKNETQKFDLSSLKIYQQHEIDLIKTIRASLNYSYREFLYYVCQNSNTDDKDLQQSVSHITEAFLVKNPNIGFIPEIMWLALFFLCFASEHIAFFFLCEFYEKIFPDSLFPQNNNQTGSKVVSERVLSISKLILDTHQKPIDYIKNILQFLELEYHNTVCSLGTNFFSFVILFNIVDSTIKKQSLIELDFAIASSILIKLKQLQNRTITQIGLLILKITDTTEMLNMIQEIQKYSEVFQQTYFVTQQDPNIGGNNSNNNSTISNLRESQQAQQFEKELLKAQEKLQEDKTVIDKQAFIIKNMEQSIQFKDKEAQGINEELKQLKDDNYQLKVETEVMKAKLAELEIDKQQDLEQHSLNKADAKIKQLEESLTKAMEEIQAKDQQIETIKNDYSQQEVNLEKEKRLTQSQKEEIANLELKIITLQNNINNQTLQESFGIGEDPQKVMKQSSTNENGKSQNLSQNTQEFVPQILQQRAQSVMDLQNMMSADELQTIKRQMKEMKTVKDNLEIDIQAAVSDKNKAQAESKKQQVEIKTLKEQIKQQQKQIEEFEQQVKLQQTEITRVNSGRVMKGDSMIIEDGTNVGTGNKVLLQNLEEGKILLEQKKQEILGQKTKIKDLEKLREDQQRRIRELSDELKKTQDELSDQKKNIGMLGDLHEEELAIMEDLKTLNNEENPEKLKAIKHLMEKLKNFYYEVKFKRMDVNIKRDNIIKLNRRIEELEAENQTYFSKLEEIQNKLQEKNYQIEDLQFKHGGNGAEKQSIGKKFTSLILDKKGMAPLNKKQASSTVPQISNNSTLAGQDNAHDNESQILLKSNIVQQIDPSQQQLVKDQEDQQCLVNQCSVF